MTGFNYSASDKVSIELNDSPFSEEKLYDITIKGVVDDADQQMLEDHGAAIIAHLDVGEKAFVALEVESDLVEGMLQLMADNNLGINAAEAQAASQKIHEFEGV